MDKQINTIPVRIDPAVREILTKEAEIRQLKLSDIIREALREFIGSHNLIKKHGGKNG